MLRIVLLLALCLVGACGKREEPASKPQACQDVTVVLVYEQVGQQLTTVQAVSGGHRFTLAGKSALPAKHSRYADMNTETDLDEAVSQLLRADTMLRKLGYIYDITDGWAAPQFSNTPGAAAMTTLQSMNYSWNGTTWTKQRTAPDVPSGPEILLVRRLRAMRGGLIDEHCAALDEAITHLRVSGQYIPAAIHAAMVHMTKHGYRWTDEGWENKRAAPAPVEPKVGSVWRHKSGHGPDATVRSVREGTVTYSTSDALFRRDMDDWHKAFEYVRDADPPAPARRIEAILAEVEREHGTRVDEVVIKSVDVTTVAPTTVETARHVVLRMAPKPGEFKP